jgi:protein ImuB
VDVNDAASHPTLALRRFRFPVPVRVRVEVGRPIRITVDRRVQSFVEGRGFSGGRVTASAGPWRTSGAWWANGRWDRDGWDVTLHDGVTYRVFHERDTDGWFLEGIVD